MTRIGRRMESRALLAAAIVLALCGDGSPGERGNENAAAPAARRLAVGVSSCSAQPCHGDVARDAVWPIWGNEVTIWIAQDPHAQAYRTLSNERSKKMAERLKLGVPANRSERCLRCHSPFDVATARGRAAGLADGVGCEACHGAAQDWLALHTRQDWPTLKAQDSHGMRDTRNLHARTRACAACHVGTAPRDGEPGDDVDHDLIAAGHPPLKFEATAYLAKMPKHWDEKDPRTGKAPPRPDFEAQAWAVGQAASAAAALDLLAYRAKPGQQKSWPEFAEYDCYSCHHQLYGTGRRARPPSASPGNEPEEDTAAKRPGLPTWGTWYLSLAEVLPGGGEAGSNSVAEIDRLMRALPADRQQLVHVARETARRFDASAQTLAARASPAVSADDLLARMKQQAPRIGRANWDGEAQLYLALVAMHYAKHGTQTLPSDDPLTRSLRSTREELMFPASADDERRFDSPRDLDAAAALRERLLPEIERLLKE
ncbi:MAG TPA: multiheme c-type cytochrome [Pirellulales bacterium]|nr:multiheme c-type cytochrome [Pirellulales bacterium]